MRITNIQIAGFKSFVDEVSLPIDEGLTGVVGPNGCGKSNLLEALRWAMGANSAKALRGTEMDDVIFSGADNRPAREHADVTLLLDNSKRLAPAQFNDSDVIEISRRIRRERGSDYKLNGQTVRAKDIQLLFADASTGANSPALVRQGQISELIAAKPQNRRRLLEEAANISGLNQRRHEAELKLNGAENNLTRITENLEQLEEQFSDLKRQARKAERYKGLADKISGIEALLAHFEWEKQISDLEKTRKHSSELEDQLRLAQSELTKAQTASLKAGEVIEPLREKQIEAATNLAQIQAERIGLKRELEEIENSLIKTKADLERYDHDISREENLKTDAEKALQEINTSLAALNELDLEQQHSKLDSITTFAQRQSRLLESIEGDWRQALAEMAEDRASENSLNQEIERLNLAMSEAKTRQKALLTDEANLQPSSLFDAAFQASIEKLTKSDNEIRESEETLAKAEEQYNLEETAFRNSEDALQALLGKERALRSELQTLMAQYEAGSDSPYPPLLEQVKVDAGFELAFAAALGDDALASDEKAAPEYWTEISGNSQPYNAISLPKLSDVCSAPNVLKPRLDNCFIIDNKPSENDINSLKQGQLIVNRSGCLWRWDGFVRQKPKVDKSSSRLELKNRIDQLQATLEQHIKSIEDTKQAHQKLDSARSSSHAYKKQVELELKELQASAQSARKQSLQAEQEQLRHQTQLDSLVEQKARAERTLADITTRLETAKATLSTFQFRHDAARLEELENKRNAATIEAQNAQNELRSFETEIRSHEQRLASLSGDHTDWTVRLDTAKQRLDDLKYLQAAAQTQLTTLETGPQTLRDKLANFDERVEKANAERQAHSDSLSEAESQLRVTDQRLRDCEREMASLTERRYGLDQQIETGEMHCEQLRARITDHHSVAPNGLKAKAEAVGFSPDKLSQEDASNRRERLLREQDSVGGVNFEASEQAETKQREIDTLTHERDDLVEAISKLRHGVQILNREGREKLNEAFEKIESHFKQLFQALFQGGEAELRLTESDDVLQSGLEIYACPPGKRLSHLSLMSGGEQALTATALIFAVFLANPAPICVLDEVDAPLDDANVDRFCRLLEEMCSLTDTRFVIITHNPVSMSRMNRLYGVTMQEKGVSKIVSVDLERAEAMVAAE